MAITEAMVSTWRCVGCTGESPAVPRGPRPVTSCTAVMSTRSTPIAAHVRHDNN